jgi:hypothetical protein
MNCSKTGDNEKLEAVLQISNLKVTRCGIIAQYPWDIKSSEQMIFLKKQISIFQSATMALPVNKICIKIYAYFIYFKVSRLGSPAVERGEQDSHPLPLAPGI